VSFRTILILINVVAIAALLVFIVHRVVSLRRNPHHRDPDNLTPFFDDDVLEGAHLERALGVSLVALVIVLIGMIGYFMWEPFRADAQDDFFVDKSIERGAVLFANESSEDYNSNFSLACADCHGVDGGGGSAPNVQIASVDPRCTPPPGEDPPSPEEYVATGQEYCLPKQVSWAAPNLQLAGLRYTRAQINEIITYGRPGTPMQAWGVASGKGSLNEQSVNDLVSYIESIALTTDKAKALSDRDLADRQELFSDPAVLQKAQEWVAEAEAELAEAEVGLAEVEGVLQTADRREAEEFLEFARENLLAATEWRNAVLAASDGQMLFMNNCARCHTLGWSSFDPQDPAHTTQGLMGGGAFGPNLRGGQVNEQFPPPNGEAQLFSWISEGAPENEGYGKRGISSGRMPHFGAILSSEQICQIMAYERSIENPPLSTAADAGCVAGEESS